MNNAFWKSAGYQLVKRDERGWLSLTPDYLRAYFTRPEIHPVDDSCGNEHRLFEKLMADPFAAVSSSELEAIVDKDAADNYRIILRFRNHLVAHGTIEGAYAALFMGEPIRIPPVFIDQMVHLILRNILEDCSDPFQLRTAELFFREQAVMTGEEQLMLADQEIVEMRSEAGFGSLGQLLAESGTPMREVSLDVMTEENCSLYWERSDQFDMAVDFRFTQPAQDAFGQVIQQWIHHFLKVETRITAVKSVKDEKWSWHVGCDAESTRIMNALYEGKTLSEDVIYRLLALYRLEFLEYSEIMDTMRSKPVYLGLAMNADRKLVMKPQNLLTNLPLMATS
ncbi:MAG: hypothetical protein JJ891_08780 [Rhizobiaceae bacterium]|nr:hypothetical protein [Rhizobiaceae bacterium]